MRTGACLRRQTGANDLLVGAPRHRAGINRQLAAQHLCTGPVSPDHPGAVPIQRVQPDQGAVSRFAQRIVVEQSERVLDGFGVIALLLPEGR